MMVKNVTIPLFLLERIIEFLDNLNIPERHELSYEYGDIVWALKVKIQKLELRGSYSKIILADDEARIRYLQQRDPRLNDMVENGEPF
jgi:hypothetical protein